MAFNNVYAGKRVLITGNTGFKGSWLSLWLNQLGAEIFGYSIDIPTTPSLFEIIQLREIIHHTQGDIRDKDKLAAYIQDIKPDFIFHLAAQAIVSTSYQDPFGTITTNVIGTAAICDAIRCIDWPCTCVLITSDKAYNNVEWIWGYRETDALGGKDIYSGSKGAAELVIHSYWDSFLKAKSNIRLGIARAGNVIGGGDWAKDRIIVDCVKAFSRQEPVEIRSPYATRPWQHVLEPLSGYLTLGWYLSDGKCANGEPYNFGPRAEQNKTVVEVVQDLAGHWGIEADCAVKQVAQVPFNEATLLKLNCDKALANLHWHSTLNYDECIRFVSEWYYDYCVVHNQDMRQLTNKQIADYTHKASQQNLKWAL